MTARELYEYALIELNKLEAPSLLLEDYNYFINKAVQQYINLVYAKTEINQQSTDDIRVLKASSILSPQKLVEHSAYQTLANGMFSSSYYVDLPADYMHVLNCIIEFKVSSGNFKCYDKNDLVYFAARRLTPDMYSQVLNNSYMRPMYKRPYYYLNNINTSSTIVTNSAMDAEILEDIATSSQATPQQISAYYSAKATLVVKKAAYEAEPTSSAKKTEYEAAVTAYNAAASAIMGTSGSKIDSQNREADRLSNPSTVRMELRFGKDDGVFVPNHVYVDYLKSPMYIRLTQDQINSTLDYSQILEFPDYVCFEIANIFVRLLMENASDPRLQTNMPINNTISAPNSGQEVSQQQQS